MSLSKKKPEIEPILEYPRNTCRISDVQLECCPKVVFSDGQYFE